MILVLCAMEIPALEWPMHDVHDQREMAQFL